LRHDQVLVGVVDRAVGEADACVSPRRRDPFVPDPGVEFSKGAVDRGARLILGSWQACPRPDAAVPVDGADVQELVDAMTAVTWWRGLHAGPLSKVAANLRYHVAKEGGRIDGRIDISQRLKRRPTMIDKLEREPQMNLTQMADIGGVRARLPSLAHVQSVSRRLQKTWTVVRTRDYVADPKASGYRAIHHVVRRDGRLIEVQLRTVRQDAWANQVEDDGRDRGVGFKFGFGAPEVHAYYVVMAEAFEALDRGLPLSGVLVARLEQAFTAARPLLPRTAFRP